MPVASVPDFLKICRTSRLLNSTQVDELTRSIAVQDADPKVLARELVHRGWLTAWHVNHLFQGRSGDLLLGSDVLLEKLGEGGMGTVYKARNWKLGRIAAVKVIRPERLTMQGLVPNAGGPAIC
jgi:serine/threonine-protein kinase